MQNRKNNNAVIKKGAGIWGFRKTIRIMDEDEDGPPLHTFGREYIEAKQIEKIQKYNKI